MFNIFYFSNAKMYVMYVRKKCLILFFISIAQNHFFRRKKIYNACRQKCLMFSFSNFRKYVMHDVMHARKILNVFFIFQNQFLKNNEIMQCKMRLMFFYFQKLFFKKKEYVIYVRQKLFNIFYFSNPKMYVMYVRKKNV